MDLNSRCQIVREEGAQTFQVSRVLTASILGREVLGLDAAVVVTEVGQHGHE